MSELQPTYNTLALMMVYIAVFFIPKEIQLFFGIGFLLVAYYAFKEAGNFKGLLPKSSRIADLAKTLRYVCLYLAIIVFLVLIWGNYSNTFLMQVTEIQTNVQLLLGIGFIAGVVEMVKR